MRMKLFCTVAIGARLLAAQSHDSGYGWSMHQDETIQRTFQIQEGSGLPKLQVENVSGYIHVTGYTGNQIQVKVRKRMDADSAQQLETAKQDVKLGVSQQGNAVRLFVDGPFREHDDGRGRDKNGSGYRVAFDYDIQVPAATQVVLKTINDGDIVLRKTTGDYDIRGLNGGIQMEEVGGSGTVRTLNGPVKVSFSRNPERASEFRTLNGKMEIDFQPGLNADVNFRTLNGAIYTDFEVAVRPAQVSAGEGAKGKWVYRLDRRRMSGRVGAGGPELTFETLNGEILLRSKA
jgi:hypothetical protein